MPPDEESPYDALLRKIAADKEAKTAFVHLAKKVEPNWQVPADVAVDDLRQETRAELEAMRLQRETDRSNAELDRKRAALADRYGPDAVQTIEKEIMTKYGLADYELAGRVYAAEQPAPDRERRDHQIAKHGATWEMPQINLGEYMANPRKAALDEAYRVIDEFKARR